MLAYSFEAQTQRVKNVCLHIILSSFFFYPFSPLPGHISKTATIWYLHTIITL